MKILLILTGGTIGSTLDNATIAPNSATQSKLISMYEKEVSENSITFETISPFEMLSENLQPSDWTTLIELIREQDLSLYDGIIMTHGTDTLSFTANALELCLPELPIALMLVSAHTPLEDHNSNGLTNFKAAISSIESGFKGVYTCYQNPTESFVSIISARQLTQSLQLSSHFEPLYTVDARFDDDTLTVITQKKQSVSSPYQLKPFFSEELLYIKPYPGLNYDNYQLKQNGIIIHDLYHSGTCDTNRLKPFIRQCKRQNILLLLAPIKQSDTYYETTQELIDMGAHFLFDISIEHAIVKTMLALKNFSSRDEILEFLE